MVKMPTWDGYTSHSAPPIGVSCPAALTPFYFQSVDDGAYLAIPAIIYILWYKLDYTRDYRFNRLKAA
jgi:hypothetical protein